MVVPVNKTRRDCFLLRDGYYYKGMKSYIYVYYIYTYTHILYYNKGRLVLLVTTV